MNKSSSVICGSILFWSRLVSLLPKKEKEFLFQLSSLTHPKTIFCPQCLSTSKVILLPGRIFPVRHCPLYDWQAHYPIPITILPNQSIHCVLLEAEKAIFCMKMTRPVQEGWGEWMSVRVQFAAEQSSGVYWRTDQYYCRDELRVTFLLCLIQTGTTVHDQDCHNGDITQNGWTIYRDTVWR